MDVWLREDGHGLRGLRAEEVFSEPKTAIFLPSISREVMFF